MKNPFKKIVSTKKRRYLFAGVLLVLIIIAIMLTRGNGEEAALEIYAVAKSDVVQEVSVTGRVEAPQATDLAFTQSGRVARIAVKTGDTVAKGDLLIALDSASAQANLDLEEAHLAGILAGSRSEEIAVSQAGVSSSDVAFENAADDLVAQADATLVSIDGALRGDIDSLFENADTSTPSYGVSISSGSSVFYIRADSEDRYDINRLRASLADDLSDWREGGVSSDPIQAFNDADRALGVALDLTNRISKSLSSYSPSSLSEAQVYDRFRTNVSQARSSLLAAQTALRSSKRSYDNAEAALEVSKQQLNVTTAEPASADVRAAQASVARAQALLSDMFLRAPFSGTVTAVAYEEGEIAGPGTTAVSLISAAPLQIKASVPEADIVNISEGDVAEVTFDAIPGDLTLKAHIVAIDPASTIVDGVAVYGITLEFDGSDPRVRPGLTANVVITAETHSDVLVLPQRYIITRDEGSFVELQGAGTTTEQEVEPGLRGSDGTTEILSGLEEGQTVVLPDRSEDEE